MNSSHLLAWFSLSCTAELCNSKEHSNGCLVGGCIIAGVHQMTCSLAKELRKYLQWAYNMIMPVLLTHTVYSVTHPTSAPHAIPLVVRGAHHGCRERYLGRNARSALFVLRDVQSCITKNVRIYVVYINRRQIHFLLLNLKKRNLFASKQKGRQQQQ